MLIKEFVRTLAPDRSANSPLLLLQSAAFFRNRPGALNYFLFSHSGQTEPRSLAASYLSLPCCLAAAAKRGFAKEEEEEAVH